MRGLASLYSCRGKSEESLGLQNTSAGGTLGSQLLPLDKPVHFETDLEYAATASTKAEAPSRAPGVTRYNAKVRQ